MTKNSSNETNIAWLTDSHIGKKKVEWGESIWEISPLEDLSSVLHILDSIELDGLIYTGDLFHEDTDGIETSKIGPVKQIFELHLDDALPIRYIKGNHAGIKGNEDIINGETVWSFLEREGVAAPLTTEPYEVGDVGIYGIDHSYPDSDDDYWSLDNLPQLQPTSAEHRILCLHQAVHPLRTHDRAIDTEAVLSKLSRSIEGVPEVVLTGHIHDRTEGTIEVDGQEVLVLSYEATTRLGNSVDDFPPSAGLIVPGLQNPEIRYLCAERSGSN